MVRIWRYTFAALFCLTTGCKALDSEIAGSIGGAVSCPLAAVAIAAPAAGYYAQSANHTSFAISGTCSEEGGSVVLSGDAVAVTTCVAGAWSANLDFSAASQGALAINAAHTCSGGALWVSDTRSFNKDTIVDIAPSALDDGVQISSLSSSPVVSFASATDSDAGVQKHQVRVLKSSDSSVVQAWTDHNSGDAVTGLTLQSSTSYHVEVRALDNEGNISTSVSGDGWVAGQATGQMNISWAGSGVHWITGTNNDQYNYFTKVLVDTSGRVLVTGAIKNSGEWGDIILHRLLANGTLDSTFDSDGKISINLTPFDYGIGLFIDSLSRIIMGGAYTTTENPFVTRMDDSGAIDTTFGASGWGVKSIAGENYARAMAVDPTSGAYYLVGDDYGDTAYVVRFTSAGAVDNSFSADGHVTLNTHTYAYATSAAVDADGKLVVVGHVRPGGAADDWAAIIWRLNSDGSFDTTFNGGNSYKLLDDQLAANVTEEAHGLLIDGSNNYFVFGNATDGSAIRDLMVWKIDSSAQFVASYGNSGVVQLSDIAATNASASALNGKFDLAGNLVISGYAGNGTNDDLLVLRLLPSGAYDPTFGSSGKLILSSLRGYNGSDSGYNLDIGADGKIYICGRSYYNATRADAILIQVE